MIPVVKPLVRSLDQVRREAKRELLENRTISSYVMVGNQELRYRHGPIDRLQRMFEQLQDTFRKMGVAIDLAVAKFEPFSDALKKGLEQ